MSRSWPRKVYINLKGKYSQGIVEPGDEADRLREELADRLTGLLDEEEGESAVKRVYITSSLLSKWDKKGADDEQFLRAYNWDGKELTLAFATDFKAAKLGRPHHMKFTARPAGTALAEL